VLTERRDHLEFIATELSKAIRNVIVLQGGMTGVEKTEEPVGGKATKPPTNEIRDARLVDPENLGRLCLRQASLLDDQGDPGGKANVFEDIPAAPFDRNPRDRAPIRPTCSSSHDPVRLD